MSYCASLLRMCLVSCFVSRARMFKVAGNGAGNARSSAERSNLLFEVRYEEMKTLENLFDIFWMPCSKLVKAGQLIIMGCLPFPAVAFWKMRTEISWFFALSLDQTISIYCLRLYVTVIRDEVTFWSWRESFPVDCNFSLVLLHTKAYTKTRWHPTLSFTIQHHGSWSRDGCRAPYLRRCSTVIRQLHFLIFF